MDANMHWARLVEGEAGALVVYETISFDPAGRFDPALRWEPCPADTRQGASFNPQALTFTNLPLPVAVEPVEPAPNLPAFRTLMTPIRFKAQFSVGEQVAIKRARAYAGEDESKAFARDALDILFGSLDDPRLVEVDVADPSVIGGIDFCQSIGILTAERAATIKLGVLA